jgi:hypothetical protein
VFIIASFNSFCLQGRKAGKKGDKLTLLHGDNGE